MIWVISLPCIDTRYTTQWFEMVEKFKREKSREDLTLLGSKTPYKVGPTEFLNYRDYMSYAWPQILEVIQKAQSGDTVFFLDGETPGAEALEYVRKMEGMDLKVRMYWHSGSYDVHDLPYLRGVQGEHYERGWFDMAEKLYVGSEYHKRALHETRDVPLSKVEVTGSPLDFSGMVDGRTIKKARMFMYTGRKVAEKGYEVVQDLQKQRIPIEVSLDQGWSKAEYRTQIAQTSMLVNPAKHELFGYALMEAFAMNVPAMVPDEGVFPSMVPAQYRVPYDTFRDPREFLRAAADILRGSGGERRIAEPYEYRKVMERWFA